MAARPGTGPSPARAAVALFTRHSEETPVFRTARRVVGVGALAAGLLWAAAAPADDSKLKVKVGDPFPDIPVPAAQADKVPGKKAGDPIGVADLKGKLVVVAFYPKALTKG